MVGRSIALYCVASHTVTLAATEAELQALCDAIADAGYAPVRIVPAWPARE
ncbi:hypothetical protein H3H36_16710 [Duganella sp. FT3S]|uniref:Uncharacterized protein n=1 Tax=Rugamonas fusca TaxID=2758568 RepID=A0A7W2EJQ1_9BURK|nr:hypothetical protein [Rugamonas fusca]MBA5607000.1 hypothetical protein [Rugamonas fusca]